ncbi:MAG: hypothetical protein LH606_11640 [Cytophagaceae bacterium]|nr:hypothetical protein [Cytophagaceae bacterium]
MHPFLPTSILSFRLPQTSALFHRKIWFVSLLFTLLSWAGIGNEAVGQSLRFSREEEGFILRNSENVVRTDSFTVEAWINSPHWRNAWWENTIVSVDEREPRKGFVMSAGGRRGGAGQLCFSMISRESRVEIVSPPLLETGRWYHVAAVVEQPRVTLYIDGRKVAQSDLMPGYMPGSQPIRIGSSALPYRCMNGAIDEVRIWNKSRTQAEIRRDKSAALRGTEPGLVVYFPMEKATGRSYPNKVASDVIGEFENSESSFWAKDYEPIPTDVGIEQIEGPDVFTAQQGPRRIKVAVRNYGTQAVDQIPLVYLMNGKEILRDTLRKTLAAGASYAHKTRVLVDCAPADSTQLVIRTALPGDVWTRNDTAKVWYRKQALRSAKRVLVFDTTLHNFGAGAVEPFQFRRVILPEDNRKYSRILMHVRVTCPKTGCDEWDRVGQIFVHKNGQTYELGRFITPYGVACQPWTIDVTDFKSLLQGNCLLQSYIHTFTLKGLKLTMSLEFVEGGLNPYPHQKVTALWQTDRFIYGDDRFSTQLPVARIQPNPKTRAITFRHTMTGLGQGNTDGAGEFARKTHLLVLKKEGKPDSTVIKHLLWRGDCDKNPCSFQKGSYTISRAGWCPGQEVRPFSVNLPTGTGAFTLDYRLQPYKNLKNTDYNNGTHTPPHFWIYSYLIEKSDSLAGFLTHTNIRCQRIEVVDNFVRVWVVNNGTETISGFSLHGFVDGVAYTQERIAVFLKPNQERVITLSKRLPNPTGTPYKLAVMAELEGDENVNDDVATLTK